MTLTLPYPPTTNHAYTVARGRKVKSAAARKYQADVMLVCAASTRLRDASWSKLTRFAVRIIVHPPDNRKRDLGNTEKLAIDAVFGWLGLDDSQVDDLRLVRDEVQTGGLLVVEIETVTA